MLCTQDNKLELNWAKLRLTHCHPQPDMQIMVYKASRGWEFTNKLIFKSCATKRLKIWVLEFVLIVSNHPDKDE